LVWDIIPQQWAAIIEANDELGPMDPYQHWEQLADDPVTGGVTRESRWAAMKLARSSRMHRLPFFDAQGRPFRFCVPDPLLAGLHQFDLGRETGGIDADARRQAAAGALWKETVGSARLAGISVPEESAVGLLRAGRPPRDPEQRQIHDLHTALQMIADWRDRDPSPELILELHRIILAGAPGRNEAAGRLRREGEASAAIDALGVDGRELPPAGDLPRRLELMCTFAHDQPAGEFIHPLIRAAILHFWLAHDAPFVDGNGRVARALFRWVLLRRGYDQIDRLPVSAALAQAPAQYALSIRRSETDENDLTYFVLHQAAAVETAERAMREGNRREAVSRREAGRKLQSFAELNSRQQALIAHALRHPETTYVIAGHQRSHGVTHQTARDDLFDLVRRGLLAVSRERRIYRFRAVPESPR
jgi:Fic family protein